MIEKSKILTYYHQGVLDFFEDKIKSSIIRIFISDDLDENYKKDVSDTYNYLSGYTYRLKQIVEEKREKLNNH
jgi:hypothetical protein